MSKPRLTYAEFQQMRVKSAAFSGASWESPDVRNWAPSQGSADSDILPELTTLMRRSRDLDRNHGVANGARQTQADNILGCGLWLAPTPDYTALGKDRKWATDWRKPVKAKWRAYAETVMCDAGESLTLDGLATQVFNGAFANGDGLALPLWMPKRGYSAGTRLQVIESDRLSNPDFKPDSAYLRGGIEIDDFGAPQGYWIRNAHPGDRFWFLQGGIAKWTRIPAYTSWGRKRVIHAHDKGRAGQSRGVPAMASVISQFKVLGDFQRAYLKSAVVNAMVAMVTESSVGQEGLVELLSSNSDALSKYQENLSERGRGTVQMRDGMIVPLSLGEKLSGFAPGRPDQNYEPYVTTVFRHIATGLNMPYELLMKDFSKTNYSSARAALLEAWRFFTGRRNWLGLMFYQPVYELWLEEMVNAGEIEAPGFYENKVAWCRARWIGPGRGWVDPMKEAEAAEKRMVIGVSTLEDECAEQGKDWEEVLEQLHEEKARMKELGIELGTPKPAMGAPKKSDAVDDTGSAGGTKREDQGAVATRSLDLQERMVVAQERIAARDPVVPQVIFSEASIQVRAGDTIIQEGALRVDSPVNVQAGDVHVDAKPGPSRHTVEQRDGAGELVTWRTEPLKEDHAPAQTSA